MRVKEKSDKVNEWNLEVIQGMKKKKKRKHLTKLNPWLKPGTSYILWELYLKPFKLQRKKKV